MPGPDHAPVPVRRSHRARATIAVVAFLVAGSFAVGCSDDSDPTAVTPTDPVSTGTAPTSADPVSTGTAPTSADPAAPSDDLADGSGCTPGTPDDLPDGRWYGLVDEAAGGELVFDLACWFSGDPAIVAAAADGAESPPPNDYHTRNTSDALRTLDVEADAPVTWYPDGGDPASVVTVPYDRWRIDRDDRTFDLAVWLTVEGGIVVAIDEQWVP